jgi:hypothetical protein
MKKIEEEGKTIDEEKKSIKEDKIIQEDKTN